MNTAFQTELPPALLAEAQAFVNQGLAANLNELLAEALRRYLDSHATALTETFLHEDVTWRLHGGSNGRD